MVGPFCTLPCGEVDVLEAEGKQIELAVGSYLQLY